MGSGPASAQQKENSEQSADSNTLVNNQPIPHFKYSEEREILIEAETAAAAGTASTSFVFNYGDASPILTCASEGLGVPDTAQLSNPDQNYNSGYPQGGTSYPIPQMDPFGVYTPDSSQGTYIICVSAAGKPYLVRSEPNVITVLGNAVWRGGQITQIGTPPVLAKSLLPWGD
jgi:hypothetical protein